MPAKVTIQHRRDSASNFSNAGTVLADGEIGYVNSGPDKGKFKIGDGATAWGSLDYQRSVQSTSSPLALTSGALSLNYSTGLTLDGSNLAVNFGTSTGTVLSGTHASATTGVHGVSGAVVGTTDSQSLSNKTIVNFKDKWNVVASAVPTTANIYTDTALNWFYNVNATANYTINLRAGSGAGNKLDDRLATGESITVTVLHKNGTTAYYPTAFQVDDTVVTPVWQVGISPAGGDVSAINTYTFTVLKTGSATFTVFASQSKFA